MLIPYLSYCDLSCYNHGNTGNSCVDFISFSYIARSEISGSNGGMIFTFSEESLCFYNGCSSLHSHRQCCIRVSSPSHGHHHLLFGGSVVIEKVANCEG